MNKPMYIIETHSESTIINAFKIRHLISGKGFVSVYQNDVYENVDGSHTLLHFVCPLLAPGVATINIVSSGMVDIVAIQDRWPDTRTGIQAVGRFVNASFQNCSRYLTKTGLPQKYFVKQQTNK